MIEDIIRRVRLTPYRKGCGPAFTLMVWDTGRRDARGQSKLGYSLRQYARPGARPRVIFLGSDFAGSPLHADDSDQTIAALLSFLTLRPGDTDREYFDKYTPEQLQFASEHAEALSAEVYARFDPEAQS